MPPRVKRGRTLRCPRICAKDGASGPAGRRRARSGRAACRDEAAHARWRRLDIERDVPALGEPREAAVGAVDGDRADAREIGQAVTQKLPDGGAHTATSWVRAEPTRAAGSCVRRAAGSGSSALASRVLQHHPASSGGSTSGAVTGRSSDAVLPELRRLGACNEHPLLGMLDANARSLAGRHGAWPVNRGLDVWVLLRT